ncbi:DUF3306 domain-containing protein [Vibrio sp. Isolate30]|uniref:DUF3306 domain-containing protein n=1 Tax=Vibrio sp. Isolate30 TaxID=2908536 RepID=UPI001EFDFA8E|nr:DUF3306 domain-containing protein [Vibrio sp. Isolate30]MCG9631048.1 DUF3306 domain-containing protein [Vibrio sp. Isolate30]
MATSFFSRWSQRKLDGDKATDVELPEPDKTTDNTQASELTQVSKQEPSLASKQVSADVSSESLDSSVDSPEGDGESSSVAQLLVSEASESVKKAALRKLFLSEEFNVRDGLDDYDDDYSNLKSLGEGVADTLRDWVKETVEDSESEVTQTQEELASSSDELEDDETKAVSEAALEEPEQEDQDSLTDSDKPERS